MSRKSRGLRAYVRTRRDLCYVLGRRTGKLDLWSAGWAWLELADFLEGFGEPSSPHYKHLPKFQDLINAIRTAQLRGIKKGRAEAKLGL